MVVPASPHQPNGRPLPEGLAPDVVVLAALLAETPGGFTLRELIKKFCIHDDNEKMQLWENLIEMERRLRKLVPPRVRTEWSPVRDPRDFAIQESRYIYIQQLEDS